MSKNWVRAEIVSGLEVLLTEEFSVPDSALQSVFKFDFNLLGNPANQIPLATLVKLMEDCASYTGCDYFGAKLASLQPVETLGLLGYIGRYSNQFEQAIVQIIENMTLNMRGIEWQFSKDESYAQAAMFWSAEQNRPHKQSVLLGMKQAHNFFKSLTKQQWSAGRTCFTFSAPKSINQLKRYFGDNLCFSMDFNGFVFPKEQLTLPIETFNQRMNGILNDYLKLTGKASNVDKLSQIKLSIRSLLILQQSCSLTEIATSQNKTPRAIQYYLKKYQLSYQQLLDEVRYQLACDLLTGSEQPVSAISELIGFKDSAVFSRSFKKYKGLTPSKYRLQFQLDALS